MIHSYITINIAYSTIITMIHRILDFVSCCTNASQSTGTVGLEQNFLDCFKKMAEKPDMGEIASFDKVKLKKMVMSENILATKDTIEQEKQAK